MPSFLGKRAHFVRLRSDFVDRHGLRTKGVHMGFSKLQLSPQLLAAIGAEGYTIPTAIQQQAIPPILEGKDVLGSAQTGTGKTAAFAVPILHRLSIKTAPQNGQNAHRRTAWCSVRRANSRRRSPRAFASMARVCTFARR